jgi:hypothetical protein
MMEVELPKLIQPPKSDAGQCTLNHGNEGSTYPHQTGVVRSLVHRGLCLLACGESRYQFLIPRVMNTPY